MPSYMGLPPSAPVAQTPAATPTPVPAYGDVGSVRPAAIALRRLSVLSVNNRESSRVMAGGKPGMKRNFAVGCFVRWRSAR